jgi:hypothetical protein
MVKDVNVSLSIDGIRTDVLLVIDNMVVAVSVDVSVISALSDRYIGSEVDVIVVIVCYK